MSGRVPLGGPSLRCSRLLPPMSAGCRSPGAGHTWDAVHPVWLPGNAQGCPSQCLLGTSTSRDSGPDKDPGLLELTFQPRSSLLGECVPSPAASPSPRLCPWHRGLTAPMNGGLSHLPLRPRCRDPPTPAQKALVSGRGACHTLRPVRRALLPSAAGKAGVNRTCGSEGDGQRRTRL